MSVPIASYNPLPHCRDRQQFYLFIFEGSPFISGIRSPDSPVNPLYRCWLTAASCRPRLPPLSQYPSPMLKLLAGDAYRCIALLLRPVHVQASIQICPDIISLSSDGQRCHPAPLPRSSHNILHISPARTVSAIRRHKRISHGGDGFHSSPCLNRIAVFPGTCFHEVSSGRSHGTLFFLMRSYGHGVACQGLRGTVADL